MILLIPEIRQNLLSLGNRRILLNRRKHRRQTEKAGLIRQLLSQMNPRKLMIYPVCLMLSFRLFQKT